MVLDSLMVFMGNELTLLIIKELMRRKKLNPQISVLNYMTVSRDGK